MNAESVTGSAKETAAAGAVLAEMLRPGDLVLVAGGLGAGKTTLIQGMIGKITGGKANSPSFNIMRDYPYPGGTFHHWDLYRMKDPAAEAENIGLKEILKDPRAISAVEWPEKMADFPAPAGRTMIVEMSQADDPEKRTIRWRWEKRAE